MDDWFFNNGWIRSEHYSEAMAERVLPFLAARRENHTVRGESDRPIACARFRVEQSKGTVVIVHGFTECLDKFSEVIYALLRAGYGVIALDQRGHGHSWRPDGLSDATVVHVDDFQEYVIDLERVCAALLSDMPKPHILFAHSMGGAVSAFYLEKHPDTFDRAILWSPMIAPNRGGLPYWTTSAICKIAIALGKRKTRAFVSKPYAGIEAFETSCATGRARFDWYEQLRAQTPEYQTNGPTYGWTQQALQVTDALLARGKVERIACPVRLYAAEDDNSVLPLPQKQFIERVKYGSYEKISGSKHEIYRSNDDVVVPWWNDVLAFLNA